MFHVEQFRHMEIKDWAHTKENFKLEDFQEGVYKLKDIPNNLAHYYDFDNYISHQEDRKSIIDALYGVVKKYMLHKKKCLIEAQHAQNKLRVLDYGCGVGDLVNYLTKKGHEAVGYEPNKNARQIASEKGVKLIDNIQNQKFDVICLFHVLEHIEDLNQLINMLYRSLAVNGILIIAVPNHDAFDAHYYKKYWAAWDVPRHIWHFSKTGLIDYFKAYPFQLNTIKPMWFDAIYISMVSEQYKGKSQLWGILVGLYSNWKALWSKSYSSNIFVFKAVNKGV